MSAQRSRESAIVGLLWRVSGRWFGKRGESSKGAADERGCRASGQPFAHDGRGRSRPRPDEAVRQGRGAGRPGSRRPARQHHRAARPERLRQDDAGPAAGRPRPPDPASSAVGRSQPAGPARGEAPRAGRRAPQDAGASSSWMTGREAAGVRGGPRRRAQRRTPARVIDDIARARLSCSRIARTGASHDIADAAVAALGMAQALDRRARGRRCWMSRWRALDPGGPRRGPGRHRRHARQATIVLSSREPADVEIVCDRVAVLDRAARGRGAGRRWGRRRGDVRHRARSRARLALAGLVARLRLEPWVTRSRSTARPPGGRPRRAEGGARAAPVRRRHRPADRVVPAERPTLAERSGLAIACRRTRARGVINGYRELLDEGGRRGLADVPARDPARHLRRDRHRVAAHPIPARLLRCSARRRARARGLGSRRRRAARAERRAHRRDRRDPPDDGQRRRRTRRGTLGLVLSRRLRGPRSSGVEVRGARDGVRARDVARGPRRMAVLGTVLLAAGGPCRGSSSRCVLWLSLLVNVADHVVRLGRRRDRRSERRRSGSAAVVVLSLGSNVCRLARLLPAGLAEVARAVPLEDDRAGPHAPRTVGVSMAVIVVALAPRGGGSGEWTSEPAAGGAADDRSDDAGAPEAVDLGGGRSPPRARISSVCSPRSGGGRRIVAGVPASSNGHADLVDAPEARVLEGTRLPSAAAWGEAKAVGESRIGPAGMPASSSRASQVAPSAVAKRSARIGMSSSRCSTRSPFVANRALRGELGQADRRPEARPLALAPDADRDLAVGGRERLVRHDARVGVAAPDGRDAGHERGLGLVDEHRERALEERDVDALAVAPVPLRTHARAPRSRPSSPASSETAPNSPLHDVADRDADLHRPPVRLAGDRHQAANRLDHEVVAGLRRRRDRACRSR